MTMLPSETPASQPGWTVLTQVPRMITGPGGIPTEGFRITAQLKTPPGSTFFVDVPANQYPQAARAMLAAKAADVYSVDVLEG